MNDPSTPPLPPLTGSRCVSRHNNGGSSGVVIACFHSNSVLGPLHQVVQSNAGHQANRVCRAASVDIHCTQDRIGACRSPRHKVRIQESHASLPRARRLHDRKTGIMLLRSYQSKALMSEFVISNQYIVVNCQSHLF